MISLPSSLRRLIKELAELPSIGPRQATRLAFHLAALPPEKIVELAEAVAGLGLLQHCARCLFIFEPGAENGDLCDICANPGRDQSLVMIVEKETDLISLEHT